MREAVFLFCACLAGTASAAEPALRARVIVHDVEAPASLTALSRRLTDDILLALSKNADVAVIGQRELEMLAEHANDLRALAQCRGERSCVDALNTAVDVDRLLTAKLAQFDAGYLLTLTMIDAKRADVSRGESCVAASEAELIACGASTALQLFDARDELSLVTTASAATIGPSRLAVLDLEALGVAPELAASATELVALELRKLDGISVVRLDEVRAMLDYEAQKQLLRCKSDVECLMEIGGALGVEYLVGGAVGKLEDTWVVHLKLMDVTRAEVKNRVSESFRGDHRDLPLALRFAGSTLVGRTREGRGSFLIDAEVDDGFASIDGQAPRPLAGLRAPLSVSAGRHAIAIRADGYELFQREFYVEDRNLVRLAPELVEIPTDWYEKWWVWTIVGVAVAGGVTSAVLISAPDSPPGSVRAQFPAPGEP